MAMGIGAILRTGSTMRTGLIGRLVFWSAACGDSPRG